MEPRGDEGLERLWRDFEIVAGFLLVLISGSFGFLWRYSSTRIAGLWKKVNDDTKYAGEIAIWNVRMFATKTDIVDLEKKLDTLRNDIHVMLREQRQDIAEMIKLRPPVRPEGERNDRKRNLDIDIEE